MFLHRIRESLAPSYALINIRSPPSLASARSCHIWLTNPERLRPSPAGAGGAPGALGTRGHREPTRRPLSARGRSPAARVPSVPAGGPVLRTRVRPAVPWTPAPRPAGPRGRRAPRGPPAPHAGQRRAYKPCPAPSPPLRAGRSPPAPCSAAGRRAASPARPGAPARSPQSAAARPGLHTRSGRGRSGGV